MVEAGVATTLVPEVDDKLPPGDQLYEVAPPAVSVAEDPAHIVGELTVIAGNAFTVTVEVAVPAHPEAFVPVTVYVVVDTGDAVTLAPVVADNVLPGDHVYEVAPLAVSVAEDPAHIVALLTVITGLVPTVTVVVVEAEQPDVDPVTV